MTPLPNVQTQVEYIKFGGGLDLASPVLSIKPGSALGAINYECGVFGGYQRIDGFERFDGRPSPSSATYFYTTYTPTAGTPAVGTTLTGTSGATAVVAVSTSTVLALTKVTGTLIQEAFTGGGGGTFTMTPVSRGYPDGFSDATALAAAADQYRADILKVNGAARSIRGIQMYNGTLYAFQNNAAATACELYKSSSSGWTMVALGREMAFTSGGTYVIAEGDTITGATSGATAVVTRVVLESGTFASGDAAGRLIFASQTGTFQAEDLNVGANLNVATIAANSSAITLLPSGRYEFHIYNFFGSTNTLRMYGCDGVNRAFEFDGTVFVPIRTGMTVDTPQHIHCHQKMLFLSFRGSSQNSGVGTPYIWTATTGASEIAIGEDITGYMTQPGEILAIFGRNGTYQLQGSSITDFNLSTISSEVGAIAYTVQNVGVAYGMDDRGVTKITATQAYGNFNAGTVSRLAQPVIDEIRSKTIASSVYRSRNQYRVYGNDGSGFIMTIEGNKIAGITTLSYPVNVTCACSAEDSTGKDVIFFGADNGFVYQADKGSSFDGAAIESSLRLPFNHGRLPRHRKRYRKAVMEMSSVGYAAMRFQPEFTYGDEDVSTPVLDSATVQGTGGYWDISNWDQFFYDARIVSSPEFSISGTGLNMALLLYQSSAIDMGHQLQGALIHYTIRRLAR